MVYGIYDEFIGYLGIDERAGQRKAVDLLVQLSDAKDIDSYSIQAPTGTGKSYAALVAGAHNARKGLRTVVGTSTVVLSEQYANEISNMVRAFPEVTFAVLKGASNYYCGAKAGLELRNTKTVQRKNEMMTQLKMAARGITGGIPFWAQADTDFCSTCIVKYKREGKTDCEYAKARGAALDADVVVTTHAMISVDLKNEGSILGDVHLTIFDEAHKASSSLIYSESLSASKVKKLDYSGVLRKMSGARRSDFVLHMEDLKNDSSKYEWRWYSPSAELVEETIRVWPTAVEVMGMRDSAKVLGDDQKFEQLRIIDFLARGREVLDQIAGGDVSGGIAFWASWGSYKLQDMIPDPGVVKEIKQRRVAWLSATIGTHSRETYSLAKCGIRTKHFNLESPFDYSRQLSWVVREAGKSGSEIDLIASINQHWSGGCVVLTGSHRRKERIAEGLREKLGSGVLVQEQTLSGNEGNKAALATHCDAADLGVSPVLVGVEIFSTGVDLPGDRLTKLVIAGLFPMRDDAAYANWRSRWLESYGQSGLEDYELPERAIALEQQIGRVIRRVDDTGVVVFYVDDADWVPGSKGRRVIEEALARFAGAQELR